MKTRRKLLKALGIGLAAIAVAPLLPFSETLSVPLDGKHDVGKALERWKYDWQEYRWECTGIRVTEGVGGVCTVHYDFEMRP